MKPAPPVASTGARMTTPDEEHMGAALDAARRALVAGEAPIGACLVTDTDTVVVHNRVVSDRDPTAHAEIQAIREATRRWRHWDPGASRLYVTVEPCPMCIAACHYAGIREIVYAASLADFHEITGDELLTPLASGALLTGGCRREESRELLRTWAARRAATA